MSKSGDGNVRKKSNAKGDVSSTKNYFEGKHHSFVVFDDDVDERNFGKRYEVRWYEVNSSILLRTNLNLKSRRLAKSASDWV